MTKKSLKIDIDVSMYRSGEMKADIQTIDCISSALTDRLQEKGQRASASAIRNASKNAIFLFSKKKRAFASSLTVYLPIHAVESTCDNLVPINPHDQDSLNSSASNDDSDSTSRSSTEEHRAPRISFSASTDAVEALASFDYLADCFKHSLSSNVKPMSLEGILDSICLYIFFELRSSVNMRVLRNELSLQISHLVQSARVRAAGRSVIGLLQKTHDFSLIFKSISHLNQVQSASDFSQFQSADSSGPMLLIREMNKIIEIVHFHPLSNGVDMTFNTPLTERALSSLDRIGLIDVDELLEQVKVCASVMNREYDPYCVEEALKTEILCSRIEGNHQTQFITVFLVIETKDKNERGLNDNPNDHLLNSFSDIDIDAIVGRSYATRGIKRSYAEDPISLEPKRNIYHRSKETNDRRDLLHLKDSHHLTDSALKAIFQYVKSKKKIYSLNEIERLRKETNARFPILSTKTSAYVRFEYAVRTAIFVARKFECDLEQLDTLNIRFNMDGTLIGNKHIVAISINCLEGGHQCQTSKNLVPLGLFEVQMENTELLRKSLPTEFIREIKSLKRIAIGRKELDVRVRLGGDLMNAVYLFGLSGFSSNYPCVFCTQHKDDLHVTEDTAYDKTVTDGKGKNKKTSTVRVSATSYHDSTKHARSLQEQAHCLASGTNELGYKCEPLFGDLFGYQDYCVDTLHMKLRVFDVLLKDMISHASRTGKYGAEHMSIIEQKIRTLNHHCERTVGKRFFFQVESDDKNKTIASHGKLSGHLQDLSFIDTFRTTRYSAVILLNLHVAL